MTSSTRAWNRLPRWFALSLTSLSILLAALLLAVPAGAAPTATSTAGVTPVTMTLSNSRACQELGYAYEYKVDDPRSGSYRLADGTHTVAITVDAKKVYLDWSASLSIAAVVVKGSTTANVYYYAGGMRADGQLHSPANKSGKFAQISHVSFCYGDQAPVATSTPTPPTPSGSTISGTVWSDDNGNQAVDSHEPGFAGVTVEVYLDNGDGWVGEEDTLVATTTTDAAGSYTVTGLSAGTYVIQVFGACASYIEPITVDGTQASTVDIAAYEFCGG
jgi:hypothetical protein